MKKVILSILGLLSMGVSSFAQEANAGDFNFGIVFGGGLSSIRTEEVSLVDRKPIANLQAGFALDYTFVDGFFAELGLTFQRKGDKAESEALGFKSTTTMNMLYLEAPLTLNYRIPVGDMGLIPQVGGYFAYGVGGKTKVKNEASNEALSKIAGLVDGESDTFDDTMEKVDYGLRFGLGLAFNEALKFTVGYDLGLANVTSFDRVEYKTGSLFGTLTYYFK